MTALNALFFCHLLISTLGVADQLQSNFACDLRNILKCVFELHNSDPDLALSSDKQKLPTITTLPQGKLMYFC